MTSKVSKRDLMMQERLAQVPDAAVPSEPPRAAQSVAAKSHIGQALKGLSQGLHGELTAAKSQLAEAQSEVERLRALQAQAETDPEGAGVKEIDPALVMATRFVNRSSHAFDPHRNAEFAELVEDIAAKGGNKVPGLVRPLPSPGPNGEMYECVYGHRRLSACRLNGVPFNALVAGVSDDEAMLVQQAENLFRADLSPIERGKQIASYLNHRRNESGKLQQGAREELAERLKLNPSVVSRLIAIGDIPDTLVESLPDARQVKFQDAIELGRLSRTDPDLLRERLRGIPDASSTQDVVDRALGREVAPVTKAQPKLDAVLSKLQPKLDEDERESLASALQVIKALALKHGVLKS